MPRGARLHGCGGVREGGVLANHHVICLEPPLRFTPQHSTVARLQSIVPVGWLLGVSLSLVFPLLISGLSL